MPGNKILIFGAHGLLGQAIASEAAKRGMAVVSLDRAEADITDLKSVADVFGDDQKSFTETDEPTPVNVYGRTKWKGEKLVARIAGAANLPYFVVRTSWLYGEGRKTFVDQVVETLKKREKIEVVADQYNVLTYAGDLAVVCLDLLTRTNRPPGGIYHLVNSYHDRPSKHDIAMFVAEELHLDPALLVKSFRRDVFRVLRPRSALLYNSSSLSLPDWKKSLADYLQKNYS